MWCESKRPNFTCDLVEETSMLQIMDLLQLGQHCRNIFSKMYIEVATTKYYERKPNISTYKSWFISLQTIWI